MILKYIIYKYVLKNVIYIAEKHLIFQKNFFLNFWL